MLLRICIIAIVVPVFFAAIIFLGTQKQGGQKNVEELQHNLRSTIASEEEVRNGIPKIKLVATSVQDQTAVVKIKDEMVLVRQGELVDAFELRLVQVSENRLLLQDLANSSMVLVKAADAGGESEITRLSSDVIPEEIIHERVVIKEE